MTQPALTDQIWSAINGKTKPLGALGRIETLAAQIASVQGILRPRMDQCHLTIFAADHGMAASGVSAYPQAVTRQMVENILDGGAASTVFARSLGVDVTVVDSGIAGPPLDHPALLKRRIAAGTQNALDGPAMSNAQAAEAIEAGQEIGRLSTGDAVAFGEMGIGNSSSAALLLSKLFGASLETFIGLGTATDATHLDVKKDLLASACARTPGTLPPLEALAQYGGFEIAMMAGAMMSAAQNGKIVLIDGFIATSAAAVALYLAPDIKPALVFSHVSAESGHGAALEALEAEPLLNLGLRLGEGTGALLAWPLLKAACAMLNDMASFDSANISGPSRQ